PWLADYDAARRAWSDEKLLRDASKGEQTHRNLAEGLGPAGFGVTETGSVETTPEGSASDLARRGVTFSPTPPAAAGPKVDPMLAPYSRDGVLVETLVSWANVSRRLP